MMKKFYTWTIAGTALAGLLLTGCLRDDLEPCPPLSINLTVTDKNYFNVADAEQYGLIERMDENLPFSSYVQTVYYVLHDAQTGEVVAEQLNQAVTGDGLTYLITLPDELPYGTYTFTAWGNMQSKEPLDENATAAELEAADAANNDIYLASATLDYRYGSENYNVGLERTKGRLLIQAQGLPEHIDFSVKDITNVFSVIDRNFQYSQPTDIRTRTDWEAPGEIVTHTLLGPSEGANRSLLNVYFVDKDGYAAQQQQAATLATRAAEEDVLIVPEEVNITLRRNELTVLRYVYSDEGMKIYILVNGEWEAIHQMEID